MLNNGPLVIVGGGTAGWLAALLAKKYCPEKNITVVASEEIGILGAGEGTVPHFIQVLQTLDISPEEIVKKCSGTIKLGIDFVNWNGDGQSFWHGFEALSKEISFSGMDNESAAHVISSKNALSSLSLGKCLFSENKVPFTYVDETSLSPIGFFAFHFDAHLLAGFLKDTAIERGITYINDKIMDVDIDRSGNISLLQLEKSPPISPFFVFDCSGLKRIILGKRLRAEWVSYEKELLCTKAMPFFMPHSGDVSPATSAVAMKHGWVWKIPTQERYGCGYVFDETTCSEEDAKKEIEDSFNIKLPSVKSFNFSPGYYKNPLKNNCLAVGLAHSFLEPMEATSIWGTCLMLIDFFSKKGLEDFSKGFQQSYNKRAEELTNTFKLFILAHYKSNRKDTVFWRKFSKTLCAEVRKKKDCIEETFFSQHVCFVFEPYSWAVMLSAYNRFRKKGSNAKGRSSLTARKNKILDEVKKCVTHKDFLNTVLSV